MELSEQMGTYLHFVIMPCQILTMLFKWEGLKRKLDIELAKSNEKDNLQARGDFASPASGSLF